MIDFLSIFNKLRIFIGMAAILLNYFLISKINLKRNFRYKQFLMPIIALVYSFVAILVIDRIYGITSTIIGSVARFVPFLSFLTKNLDSKIIYYANILILTTYLAIKKIVLVIVNKTWNNKKIVEFTSGFFYEYSTRLNVWVVQKKYANFRKYYQGFYYATIVITSILFVLSQIYPNSRFFVAPFYPIVGVLIVGEIVFFLDGLIEDEAYQNIFGEEARARKIANYSMLRRVLRNYFADYILNEGNVDPSDEITSDFDGLEDLEKSDDQKLKAIAKYFKDLKEIGEDINVNYAKAFIDVMNNKSVLLYNTFYKDFSNYIMLPITHNYISYKKTLVVLGDDSSCDNVKEWLNSSVETYIGTRDLIKVGVLENKASEDSIAILRFGDLYNIDLIKKNEDFFKSVGFVLLLEPSKILSTGQIGINLVVNEIEKKSNPVFCILDRNCDGLVDSLSHLLRTNLTEVTATLSSPTSVSYMCWDADCDNNMQNAILPPVSKYLGVGTELSTVAMKYQLKETNWLGNNKFPVIDMKWIAGQYYKSICSFADMPTSQEWFSKSFNVSADCWSLESKDNSYITVEDEYRNVFEMVRLYLSRSKNQGFLNIISENYLLRDYMLFNASMFLADSKAIPTFVPDFARTERNTVLKILMKMISSPLCENELRKDLSLIGYDSNQPLEALKNLIEKHIGIKDVSFTNHPKEILLDNVLSTKMVNFYSFEDDKEMVEYAKNLKNAYYYSEDEKQESHYVGSKLFGHVFQSFLPGQYICYEGKNYQVDLITNTGSVVTRRASDHIDRRRYYQQMRNITINNVICNDSMGSSKTIQDMEIVNAFAEISIGTDGYIEMEKYGDYANSKKVTINSVPNRKYFYKQVLKIKIPNILENVKYTICILLNEIFKTTYPNSYQYVFAICKNNITFDNNLDYLLYKSDGSLEDDCIYIVEDSDIDIGLVVSVEKNLSRFFEIIFDLLTWHKEQIEAVVDSIDNTDIQIDISEINNEEIQDDNVKLPFFKRVINKIKGVFVKKKTEELGDEQNATSINDDQRNIETVDENEDIENYIDDENNDSDVKEEHNDEELEDENSENDYLDKKLSSNIDSINEDISDDGSYNEKDEETDSNDSEVLLDTLPDINNINENLKMIKKYKNNNFLMFGFGKYFDQFDIDNTIKLLEHYGYSNNNLTKTRFSIKNAIDNSTGYDPDKEFIHYCDFCGKELMGGEYEVLKDGRERCNHCSLTAVKNEKELSDIYRKVIDNLETYFDIRINCSVGIYLTDANTIAKNVKQKFNPTNKFDPRITGFAREKNGVYNIYIENGSPKLMTISTLVHELTHIWQFQNWNKKLLRKNDLLIKEGMAKWAEIAYLIMMNETKYANRMAAITRQRDDEYGKGFILFEKVYGLPECGYLIDSPFRKPNKPL